MTAPMRWLGAGRRSITFRITLVFALITTAVLLGLGLAACGGDKSCKNACDKLSSCGLKSSGLSCDATCGSPDDACAVCVNATACADISAGKCSSDCTKATFTTK